MVTVGNSGAIWTGAAIWTAYLRFILIELRYSLHSDRYARAAARTSASVLFAESEQSMCNDADIIYSSQTELAGCDEWQIRIKMECECDVIEGGSTRLSFFVLCLFYHFKWQTVSNLFIFLCCNFHCVNSKMLNEFSVLTKLIKYIFG